MLQNLFLVQRSVDIGNPTLTLIFYSYTDKSTRSPQTTSEVHDTWRSIRRG